MLKDAKQSHQARLDGIEQLQSQLTFRISVLSKLLDQQMAEIAAQQDLSLGGYRAMATISAFGTISAADITRYTAYDKAAVSRHVAELSKRGLVTVTPDPDHGRRKLLTLTDAGQALLTQAAPAVEARRKALSDLLSTDEEAALHSAIEKIASHVANPSRVAT